MIFLLGKISSADETLKITQVQFDGGKGKPNEDFIEIKNISTNKINLKGYRLVKQTSSNKKYNIVSFGNKDSIALGKTYLWASSKVNDFPKIIGADISRKATISNGNGIALIFGTLKDGLIIDSINWKENIKPEKTRPKPILEEPKNYFNKIKINEIYPSPDTKIGETEFIEIKNISNKNINLKNWSVSDSVHKGKPLTTNYILQPNKFYTFKGKFYLNSSDDKAIIFDANGNLVDSLFYGKGKSKYAYAFDGTKWHWTSQPTPNSKNIFDKILSGKISYTKNIYKNIYAYFKVKTDKEAQKFTWNFGDGHKSYLKNTRHKYKKTGNYKASLKITGKGEESFYNFTVKVKKYKPPKIRIVSLCANPQGKDTKNEWIEIKNKSRKKINLKNWSIATGWDKLYNHPIRKDFKIKAGKTKKLKHSICAFTLANSKAKIELRAPDKKVVQKIKYNHKKKPISENEIYQKVKSTWKWILPPTKATSKLPINTSVKGVTNQKVIPLEIHTTPPITTTPKSLKLNSIPNYLQRKKIFQYGKTFFFSPFTQAPIIVPKNSFPTYSSQTNLYLFTTNHSSQHWLIKLTDHLWFKVNSHLNWLWLKF